MKSFINHQTRWRAMSNRSTILRILFFLVGVIAPIIQIYAQADEQLLQVATEMYQFGDKRDALDVFKQAIEKNPLNAKAHYMAGKVIIETIDKEQSLSYFLQAYKLDSEIASDILYMIAHAYHLGYKLELAKEYYNKYLKNIPMASISEDAKISEINKTERKIYECNVAKIMTNSPLKLVITDLGPTVNSPEEDYAPIVSLDQSTMYFTSRRKGSTGDKKDNDNEYFEDIYVCYSKDGKWSAPKNMGIQVNSDLHEAGIGLSPDGKKLFIYKDNDKHKGDIFVSTQNKDGVWSSPSIMDHIINTEYIENSITFTPDGKTLYFSSDRPGGKGGMDIYTSVLDKHGHWSTPSNAGDVINTEYDDEAPFIAGDARTLYFASKGHVGMGGFDIFKSILDTNTKLWSEPMNLHYPINSTDDDIYFATTNDEISGYFSSVKGNGVGDVDIFKMSLDGFMTQLASADSLTKKKIAQLDKDDDTPIAQSTPPKPGQDISNKATNKAKRNTMLHLTILDKKTKKPLEAKIEITSESRKGDIVHNTAKNGSFDYTFQNIERTRYIVTVEKSGYLFKSQIIYIPEPSEDNLPMNLKFELDDIQVGAKCIMRNISFDNDKFTLSSKSNSELTKLLGLMTDNPTLQIEIDGHTDNLGNAIHNKTLSKQRAESVIEWLVKNGINKNRFIAKGFGAERPLASNDDEEEGRELNRRTEFIIVHR